MNQKELLKEILSDLCPMIYGRWFVGDGAMLGLTRTHDLIDHDTDIDIFLLPGSSVKLPKTTKYNVQKYYMNDKFYDSTKPRVKLNKWLEYISYQRMLPDNKNLSRFKLISKIKDKYRDESIDHQFSNPNIDIFYLIDNKEKKRYECPIWTEKYGVYFNYDEVDVIGANMDLGFMLPLPLPDKCEIICDRQYGSNWRTPDSKFQYSDANNN
tara:strand:- start:509 stop:1141 length:633 start_codon:yes stop_codon:yes gene_type:complete